MAINKEVYTRINEELKAQHVCLVAVSKTKPAEDIQALYDLGHRDFGENYVQELVDKQEALPKDIRWHFIGHLQSNKVKYIAPFVHLIHGVDSFSLLKEINKQALKNDRVIDCLLQVHIAQEETKFGFSENELYELYELHELHELSNIRIVGLMGMASFSEDMSLVRSEFRNLKTIFNKLCHPELVEGHPELVEGHPEPVEGHPELVEGHPEPAEGHPELVEGQPSTLSMGMSADYKIAIEEGSNMVRIGSLLFGARNPVAG